MDLKTVYTYIKNLDFKLNIPPLKKTLKIHLKFPYTLWVFVDLIKITVLRISKFVDSKLHFDEHLILSANTDQNRVYLVNMLNKYALRNYGNLKWHNSTVLMSFEPVLRF